MHFHYVLSMGAVFALYSAWYFWIPKILGLDYNKMLGKAHFWILFIGVNVTGRMYFFDASKMSGKRFNHGLAGPGGSPNNNFVMFFKNVQESKRAIYKTLRGKSFPTPLSKEGLVAPEVYHNEVRETSLGRVSSSTFTANGLFFSDTSIRKILGTCGKLGVNGIYSSTLSKGRYYSTPSKGLNRMSGLDPWWVSGFVDGEGSFCAFVSKSSKLKIGWETQLIFNITLHTKDLDLLTDIKTFFGEIGYIKYNKGNNAVSYSVAKLDDLANVIIPHFNKYYLVTQKRVDFNLFSSLVEMVKNKEHLNKEGLSKIVSYKASLNKGMTKSLTDNFTDIVPVERTKYLPSGIPSDNWVAGFASGEGSFYVVLFKNNKYKTGYSVQLRFVIGQHSRDRLLIEKLPEFFGCGYLQDFSNKAAVCYVVTDINNIVNVIIPFFNSHSIKGNKILDYLDFCKIACLIKDKVHLTENGINEIKQLASNMNIKRESDPLE